MGSSGYFNAEVSLSRKIDVTKKTKNTALEIEALKKYLLKKEVNPFLIEVSYKDVKPGDVIKYVDTSDEDDYYEEDDDKYEDVSELDEASLKQVLEGLGPDVSCKVVPHDLNKRLAFVDLDICKQEGSFVLDPKPHLLHIRGLAECSNDIYYENDNSTGDSFKITQSFIDSLKPGDILELDANGGCY